MQKLCLHDLSDHVDSLLNWTILPFTILSWEYITTFPLCNIISHGWWSWSDPNEMFDLFEIVSLSFGILFARCLRTLFGNVFMFFFFQLCVRQLQNKGLTTFVEDYLLWHHFGKKTKEENLDLVHAFKQSIHSALSPRNLALFINSYLHRSDLQMQRPDKTSPKKVHALKSATLLITGDNSPHQDDVVNTNSRLDPEISNYFKVSESGGMPLEEQPHKVATSLILFLQGLGYCKLLILHALYSETPI